MLLNHKTDGIGQFMVFKETNGLIGREWLKMLVSVLPFYP